MVVLDEHGIEQSDAVIEAAAAAHRVFLEGTEARRRLARIDDFRVRACNSIDVLTRQRRDARQAAEKIQRHTLGRQQRARVPGNACDHRAGLHRFAVAGFDREIGFRPDRAEGRFGERKTCDDARLARGDDGVGRCVRGDCCIRRDVAGKSEIFVKRIADGRVDEVLRQCRQVACDHDLHAIADTLRVARGAGSSALSSALKSSTVMKVRWANAGSAAG